MTEARDTLGKKRRNVVFAGAFIGIALFVAAFACLQVLLPAQSHVEDGVEYGYVYSGAKSKSVDFTTAAMDGNDFMLFGSSELSTPRDVVAQVPVEVFGWSDIDIDLALIGEAYDQSLWQAMAAGAHAGKTPNDKAVIIVSPTWFEDDGLDSETFKLRFSQNLYRQFCSNPSISDESKAYLAKRLKEQGISSMAVSAGANDDPISAINQAVLGAIEDLTVRKELEDVRSHGYVEVPYYDESLKRPENVPEGSPDFASLRLQAEEDAKAACMGNDWGMDDAFYSANIEGKLDQLEGKQEGEHFSNESEFEDFSFFLRVCKESGIKPLVVIAPVHGPFYDHVGVDAADRNACYERIRAICKEYDAEVADFSDKEYKTYFLHDIVHFGWLGWVEVEEAIYDYLKD